MEFTADKQLLYRYVSPNCIALTGYMPQAIIDDANLWSTLVHPEDVNRINAQRRLLALGQSSEVEYRLVKATGDIIWVRDSARVKQEGDSILVYGVISNVTERKNIEAGAPIPGSFGRAGGQAHGRIGRSQRVGRICQPRQERFLGQYEPWIRTPLNAILGFSQLMERDPNISASPREYLDIISKKAAFICWGLSMMYWSFLKLKQDVLL
ncbi:MAG: PAS domain-containing protein [Chloroflexi bacterium]|nr:PAS domain-containing protein [Chloroflexota bacterium]